MFINGDITYLYVNCKKIIKNGSILIIIIQLVGIIPVQSTCGLILNQHNNNLETIYFAETLIEYSKSKTTTFIEYGKHINFQSRNVYREIDANLDKFVLRINVNYTAEMNFSAGFPFVIFAPIIAFGLKVENHSDYVWEIIKLKHDGYEKRAGNISVDISFDMNSINAGDKFLLKPSVAIVSDPLVYESKDLQFNKFTSLLLRFSHHVQFLNNKLLENWLLPFIAENNYSGIYGEPTRIYLHFI